jgi:hypothetical protein
VTPTAGGERQGKAGQVGRQAAAFPRRLIEDLDHCQSVALMDPFFCNDERTSGGVGGAWNGTVWVLESMRVLLSRMSINIYRTFVLYYRV